MAKTNNIIINKNFVSEENTFFRYCLIMEYIGETYSGSQKQPNTKTIQSEIEEAVKKLLRHEIKIFFSGRTDKGVHAKNQTAHLSVPFELNIRRFQYSLNSILPDNISIKNIVRVEKTFHSQKNASYRWYRYKINNNLTPSVWMNRNSLHIHERLNLVKMQKALEYLQGRHDFTGFRSANTLNPAKECVVLYSGIRENEGIINIDLIANRFLYNMVRIIVGTLIEIGKGAMEPEQILKILKTQDRTHAGSTAEAKGLTLMAVGYDETHNIKPNMETENNENLLGKAS